MVPFSFTASFAINLLCMNDTVTFGTSALNVIHCHQKLLFRTTLNPFGSSYLSGCILPLWVMIGAFDCQSLFWLAKVILKFKAPLICLLIFFARLVEAVSSRFGFWLAHWIIQVTDWPNKFWILELSWLLARVSRAFCLLGAFAFCSDWFIGLSWLVKIKLNVLVSLTTCLQTPPCCFFKL